MEPQANNLNNNAMPQAGPTPPLPPSPASSTPAPAPVNPAPVTPSPMAQPNQPVASPASPQQDTTSFSSLTNSATPAPSSPQALVNSVPTQNPTAYNPFNSGQPQKPKTKKSTIIALVVILILCAAGAVAALFATGAINFGSTTTSTPTTNTADTSSNNTDSSSSTSTSSSSDDISDDSSDDVIATEQNTIATQNIDKIVTDFTNYKNRNGGSLPPIADVATEYQYVAGDGDTELDTFFTIYVKTNNSNGQPTFTMRVYPSANPAEALGNGGNIYRVFYQSTCVNGELAASTNVNDFAVTYPQFGSTTYFCQASQ